MSRPTWRLKTSNDSVREKPQPQSWFLCFPQERETRGSSPQGRRVGRGCLPCPGGAGDEERLGRKAMFVLSWQSCRVEWLRRGGEVNINHYNCLFKFKLYFKGLHSQEQVRISDFIMIQLTKTEPDHTTRCYHHLGRNKEAIEDALFAVEREPFSGKIYHLIWEAFQLLLHFALTFLHCIFFLKIKFSFEKNFPIITSSHRHHHIFSVGAKEALGTALYSSGYFERALVEFHRVSRIRASSLYEDWITRCEETIQAFLAAANVEIETVSGKYPDTLTP